MYITLQKQAIVLKLDHDSINLKPLLHFIEHSFQNVKQFSNVTLVHSSTSELIKKRYLVKWAYKLYLNNTKSLGQINYNQLLESLHLPIQIITSNNKSMTQTATITISHTITNELSITCNRYHSQVIKSLKVAFKGVLSNGSDTRTLKIKIRTKNDLLLLKKVLTYKRISTILVTFVTHGLNFNKLYSEESIFEEVAYQEKLKKSYKVLSITNSSTKKEIKNNYRKMLRKYHPDRVYNENNEVVKLFTRRFQVIQEAYELIKEHNKVA